MKMICKNCGNEYSGKFCNKCGAKAEEVKERNPYTEVYDNKDTTENFVYDSQEPVGFPDYQKKGQQPQIPMYQPKYYNYDPQISKKSSSGKALSIVAIVLSALALLISLSALGNSDIKVHSDISDTKYNIFDDTENWVGETVTSGLFKITATDSDFSNTYNNKKAKDGYQFLTLTFKVKNTSTKAEYFECDLDCYADKKFCKEASSVDQEGYTYIKLPKGSEVEFDVVYEVPKDATSVNVSLTHYKWEYVNGEEIDDETVHTFMIK